MHHFPFYVVRRTRIGVCVLHDAEQRSTASELPMKTLRKTISLANGKYEFDLKDGNMIAARRHGEDWPAGFDMRFTNCFIVALQRIVELEECVADPRAVLKP